MRLSSSSFDDRTDADAVPDVVVDRDLLNLGIDALQGKLGPHAVGVGEILVRAGLQHIGAGTRFRARDLMSGLTSLSFSGTTTSNFGSIS